MLQSLISLDDRDVDSVLDAVNHWCAGEGIAIDSADGRRAFTAAVDLVSSHGPAELLQALTTRLAAQ